MCPFSNLTLDVSLRSIPLHYTYYRYPAVNAFSSSLQSTDIQVDNFNMRVNISKALTCHRDLGMNPYSINLQVQIRCLALVCAICRESPRPVALPYIQALSPQVYPANVIFYHLILSRCG